MPAADTPVAWLSRPTTGSFPRLHKGGALTICIGGIASSRACLAYGVKNALSGYVFSWSFGRYGGIE